MKFQLIAYLVNESEHIYWILDLEDEVHSIWDLRISGLQESKGNGFFEVKRACSSFRSDPKNLDILDGRLPLPEPTSRKSLWGEFNVLRLQVSKKNNEPHNVQEDFWAKSKLELPTKQARDKTANFVQRPRMEQELVNFKGGLINKLRLPKRVLIQAHP